MSYQQLYHYSGSLEGKPEYMGMEYDYQVADNTVVSSPGGLASTFHHYTKGMYSDASSSWDLYGPEGQRYEYGIYGDLYQKGFQDFTANTYPPPPDATYSANESTPNVENYRPIKETSIEFISPPDGNTALPISQVKNDDDSSGSRSIKLKKPWIFLIVLVFAYVALDFWVSGGKHLLFQKFHNSQVPNWNWLILYAVVFTVIAFSIAFVFQVPFLTVS
jgi:hypothetical protein